MSTYNVYCDESCHLENDKQNVMVLGAIWCPLEKVREITTEIKQIQQQHGLSPTFEIKWAKVSPAKQDFYLELISYFFATDELHFRALIIPDKSRLQHELYGHDHDTWYYKMYFTMLKEILNPKDCYRIYLDIKDTRSAPKIAKLREVLRNNVLDFQREIIERVQTVRSHEVAILQLADLLIGAVSYKNRSLHSNTAKVAIVKKMETETGYSLTRTTLRRENKVNLLSWRSIEDVI